MPIPDLYTRAENAAEFLRARIAAAGLTLPAIGVVLGSGLGGVATRLRESIAIPYAAIPHFQRATAEGHAGRLVIGRLESEATSICVAMMQGRVHAYEGYSPQDVTFPMRVLGRLGLRAVILTNAAGGIRSDLRPGQLTLIADHINFTGANPCVGPNDERFGAPPASGLRFFDMTAAYSPRLRALAREVAERQGWALAEATYLCVSGPSFETPAEIRAFRTMGADLVGMSTVYEVIVARHMGIEVLGLSLVTNTAAGLLSQQSDGSKAENAAAREVHHSDVIQEGRNAEEKLASLLAGLLPLIGYR